MPSYQRRPSQDLFGRADFSGQEQASATESAAPQRHTQPRGNAFVLAQLSGTQGEVDREGIPTKYASKSQVWRLGYADGLSQGEAGLDNIEGDPRTQSAISGASEATGVDADDLTAMSIIESTGNRRIGTNPYGYTGLMQMGRDAATDVGMRYSSLQGSGNVDNNALAGARYWGVNDQRLDEDIPRDPLHMYLAHQQGAGGTNRLMNTLESNPGKRAPRAQRNNLPGHVRRAVSGPVTQQHFYDYWSGKMQAIQDTIAARRDQEATA